MKRYVSAGCTLVTLATSIALSTAAFAQVLEGVNGSNVLRVDCGDSDQGREISYLGNGIKGWIYIQRGHTGTAEEVNRDEWSVYLHDDQDADVVLDMHTKTCTLSKDDNVRSYSVLRAADAERYSEPDDTDE